MSTEGDVEERARQDLADLRVALAYLEKPASQWRLLKHMLQRGFSAAALSAEFDGAFDALWDVVVNRVRNIATYNPAAGEEASRIVQRNSEVRALWQAIQSSGLFTDDDRLPTTELFMLVGAFPYEESNDSEKPT